MGMFILEVVKMYKKILVGLILLMGFSLVSMAEFLEPDSAFKLTTSYQKSESIYELKWEIAPGYKLYKHTIKIKDASDLEIKKITLPKSKKEFDKVLEQEVETYSSVLLVKIPVNLLTNTDRLHIVYQGCAVEGLCYPPIEKKINLPKFVTDSNNFKFKENDSSSSNPAISSSLGDLNSVGELLRSGDLIKNILVFLLLGVLLSFTPCVLPMIPILAGIILGQGKITTTRGFLLSLSYSLGMAFVYTILGITAGLLGEGLAAYFQKTWVIVLFAGFIFLFALSMFDVVVIQLPGFIQEKIMSRSNAVTGNNLGAVFLMGLFSALIIGPCVAGPLAGALVYISQTGDYIRGGLSLFSMAVGMSVPLLLTGLSAGSLLPRVGPWMNSIKYFFGLLLIAVALWMLNSITPSEYLGFVWGGFLIFCSLFTSLFSSEKVMLNFGRKVNMLVGLLLFISGIAMWLGGFLGAKNVFKPFEPLTTSVERNDISEKKTALPFIVVKNKADFDAVVKSSVKPLLLDFYADWCVSCIEMDKFTYSNKDIQSSLTAFTLVKIDVTENSSDQRSLMKAYQLFGPPALVFLNPGGEEIVNSRIIGFITAQNLLMHIKKIRG